MRAARRAVGIVRVSQTKGREGESFHSPEVQRERIRVACESNGWRLVEVHDELDVSGGKALTERPGLRLAVEAVEAGTADVIVAAYLDRLTRDPRVRDEAIDRVEAAGGEVYAADMGRQTNGTAVEQLTGTLASAVHRYVRRVAAERSADAQRRAVERGVLPWPNVPPGYRKRDDGVLERDPDTWRVALRAFRLRADGATIADVRTHLGEHGIERSYHGTQAMLQSRVYLGEIHFGELHNLTAHEPIVDRELFARVQAMAVSRGRRAKSERLLARLGILRCATCGGRMVVGTHNDHGRCYPFYRCGRVRQDCHDRPAISAEKVEAYVLEQVKLILSDAEERESAGREAHEAAIEAERARQALATAQRRFLLLPDAEEAGALEIIEQLQQTADAATERAARLAAAGDVEVVGAVDLLDDPSTPAKVKRDLIRAVIAEVTVTPGRGRIEERVRIQPVR